MATEQMLEAAPLWRRLLALLIDLSVPAALGALVWFALPRVHGLTGQLILVLAAAVLALGWWLLLWWGYGSRGAGVGYQALGLRLVSIEHGRPIGWSRFFLRQLVFWALWATVVGGVMLVIFLVIDADHRGWHDLTGHSVAVVAPRRREDVIESVASERQTGTMVVVPLPAHLVAAQAQDVTQRGRRRQPGTALRRRGGQATTVRGSDARAADKRLEAQFAPRPQTTYPSIPGAPATSVPSTNPPAAGAPFDNPPASNPFVAAPGQPDADAGQGTRIVPRRDAAEPRVIGTQSAGNQAAGNQPAGDQSVADQAVGAEDVGNQGTRIAPRRNAEAQPAAGQPGEPQPNTAETFGGQDVASQDVASQDVGAQGTRIVPRRDAAAQDAGAQDVGAQGTRIISRRITPPSEPGEVGTQIRSRRGREDQPSDDRTVLAERTPRRAPQVHWFLMFDDGRELDLDAPVVVGRNPSAEPGEHTMVSGAEGTSVSKTHLRIIPEAGLVWVSDLASTNGTAILTVDGTEIVVPPNGRVQLGEGQVVAFGDHRLRLQRR